MNTNTNTNTNTTATVKEGDQYIGKWAPATAPNVQLSRGAGLPATSAAA